MEGLNKIAMSGVALLLIGLVMVVVLDPWLLGLVFVIIGAQRLFVGLQTEDSAES